MVHRSAWDRLVRLRRQRRVQNAFALGLTVLGPVLAVGTFVVLGPLGQGADSTALRLTLLADFIYFLVLAGMIVLRLMQIMHGKGLLKRDERERAHVYAAAQAQGPLQTRLMDDLIHKAFAGSGKALVMAALRGGRVSDAERAEIQQFLEDTRDE